MSGKGWENSNFKNKNIKIIVAHHKTSKSSGTKWTKNSLNRKCIIVKLECKVKSVEWVHFDQKLSTLTRGSSA